MTELSISYALLSISSPSIFTGNKFRSRKLARKTNEEGAQIVSHAPGNLGFLATLPLPLVHSSIFEARYCLDELHADGVGQMTNYGGVYLGDRRLDELMDELDGRGALAVMHPTQPAVMVPDVNEEIPVPAFEYFVETTRAFLNMAQNDTFTMPNMLAFVVPAGDYEKEAALLTELESRGEIDHAVGLANTEAMDGYMLADKLTPRQFSELAGLDYEMAQVVYAAEQGDYGKLMGNIASYKVSLIDMFLFACEQADAGIIQLDAEQMSMLSDAQTQMRSAKAQLQGSDYSRMLLYLTLPVSGDETYAFIDTVRTLAQSYYPDGNVYVAGDSTNEYDFQKSFARDNTVVSIVSILIVLVVLFTFLSAGMPVLLILVIQGSIWINFSIPAVLNQPLFFMSYLVVSSIQMGANIDYAIVIASRYQELKNTVSHRDAMIETLNFAFPTVITSSTILAVAGTLIGQMTSEAAIVGIGQSLGRGTIISMLFVLFVLPQILLLGGGLADKTSISMPTAARTHQSRERVFVVGLVTGEISGTASGRGGRNRLHRLSASAAGLCQALRRGYLFKGLTVVLTDDIDADGAAASIPIFLGDFDGQGHKITGLRLTESCSEYDLFSRVESGASVRNLTVEGEVIPAGTQTDVGGIVGQMVADITLRFSSGGLDELEQAFALMADGHAAPDTAQLRADIGALQAADGVPEELLHLTLRFAARGKVLKRQTFVYGDSFTADDFPEAPKKDGCYADWNVTDLSDLRFDTTVTAVYRPYVTALAAGDTEDGRPALLAEGLFRTGDTLQAVQADTADAPRGAAGVWTLTLPAIAAVITLVIRKRRAKAAKCAQ